MASYALFIGINQYPRDRSLPELHCARRDAVELWTLFKERLGYGAGAVLLESPSALEVAHELEVLGDQVRSGDTFVFYFAGHGWQANDDQYLLMPGARMDTLRRASRAPNDVLSLNGLLDTVANWRGTARSLFILDACRSAIDKQGARDDGRLQAQVEAVLLGLNPRDMLLRRRSHVATDGAADEAPRAAILNACQNGGQAYEIKELGRGVFSLGMQRRAEYALQHGLPFLVVPAEVEALGGEMHSLLPPHWQDRPQRPWLTPLAEPVLLWRPPAAAASGADAATATGRVAPPGMAHAPNAQERDERLWKLAVMRERAQGVKAYEDYIENAPGGARHIDDAFAAIEALHAEEAAELDRPAADAKTQAQRQEEMRPGRVFRDAPYAPEMVVIPAGRFLMGSPEDEPERHDEEGPQREVRIASPFAMGRHPVTFEEYDTYAKALGLEPPDDELEFGRGGRPVINVSWDDAQGYVRWLNSQFSEGKETGKYRLPTEAEWEYAARGGTATAFWWGNTIDSNLANYKGNIAYNGGATSEYRKVTTHVRTFKPNPFGLYDVHGNVCEWVQDGAHDNYDGAPIDGSEFLELADVSLRISRGGSFIDEPRLLRAAYREGGESFSRNVYTGFRVAKSVNWLPQVQSTQVEPEHA